MLAKSGRAFNCSTCPEMIQKKRRCHEDRWDFTEDDDPSIFPIYIHKGGAQYGFCPAKATWDDEVATLFRTLHIAATTGAMWENGSLKEQPTWWVELLSWFIQRYDGENFSSKVRAVMGDGSSGSSQTSLAKKIGAIKNGGVTGNIKR